MIKVSTMDILEEIKWRARQHRVLNIELEYMFLKDKIHKPTSAKNVAKSAAWILEEIKWRSKQHKVLNIELEHIILK